MSKKSKRQAAPEAPPAGDLIVARVAHERAWCYARWIERMTFDQIRIAAGVPTERGGLGYDLSKQAIKSLVQQARADNGDLTMSADERRERQLIEVDGLAAAARRDLDECYARARSLDAAIADVRRIRPLSIDDAATLARLVDRRNGISRELESAQRRLSDAMKTERDVVAGLAAATQLEAKVVHVDQVTEELNAMLARAGAPPIESTVTP